MLEEEDEISVTDIQYTHSVVLTQDCDLLQDYNNHIAPFDKHDKYLPSILLSPAYLAEMFRNGEHLKELGLMMEHMDSKRWKSIRSNNNLRYHYLQRDLDKGVNDLVIDFKHYFTYPRDLFYSTVINSERYLASLGILYREEVSYRFSHFLARIAMPDEMIDEEPAKT
ncbi:MAG: hypothetical protein ABFD97_13960 [Syntrophobacter sp.]